MKTDYETEQQAVVIDVNETESTELLEGEVSQFKDEAPEEELFFWSEPGVCG